jgi:hypothetical protein
VPAALAVLLAMIIWASHPGSRLLLVGALLSLAVLTKALMLIYAGIVVSAVIVDGLTHRPRRAGRLWALLAPVACGLIGPLALFEGWKLMTLGGHGYLQHLASLRSFAARQSLHPAWSPAEVTERLLLFDRRFGVALSSLLIAALIGGYLSRRSPRRDFWRLFAVLGAGVLVHAAYWLTVGMSWPRYFFPGLVLLCALVVLPLAAIEGRIGHAVYGAVLALAFLGSAGRVSGPLVYLSHQWFAPSELRAGQERVVAFIDEDRRGRPVVAQWWASIADLEYLSRHVLSFKGYGALTTADAERGFFVVTNRRFDRAGDRAFASLIARCGAPVLTAAPFAVHECRARTS